MKNKSIYCLFYLLPILLVETKSAFAQQKPHDSSFYTTYPDKITTRIYLSKKFNSISVPGLSGNDFQYRPNTQLNTGLGFTLKTLSINIAYGFGFMNHDEEKGKTKIIDLEAHAYPYKWAVDLLAIRYKGLYIDPKGYATSNDKYYYREDAIQMLFGVGAYRVLNYKRFSYNAAMIQSEWQKRSAGSFLYGGEMYYGFLKGEDSSFIPSVKTDDFNQAGIDKTQFLTIGAGVGYAYTLVIAKHFYAMGSLITNLDMHFTTDHYGKDQLQKNSLQPSFIYKAAVGYNFKDWNISANFAGNALFVKTASANDVYKYPIGNYRFIVAKRINKNRM